MNRHEGRLVLGATTATATQALIIHYEQKGKTMEALQRVSGEEDVLWCTDNNTGTRVHYSEG